MRSFSNAGETASMRSSRVSYGCSGCGEAIQRGGQPEVCAQVGQPAVTRDLGDRAVRTNALGATHLLYAPCTVHECPPPVSAARGHGVVLCVEEADLDVRDARCGRGVGQERVASVAPRDLGQRLLQLARGELGRHRGGRRRFKAKSCGCYFFFDSRPGFSLRLPLYARTRAIGQLDWLTGSCAHSEAAALLCLGVHPLPRRSPLLAAPAGCLVGNQHGQPADGRDQARSVHLCSTQAGPPSQRPADSRLSRRGLDPRAQGHRPSCSRTRRTSRRSRPSRPSQRLASPSEHSVTAS